MAATHHTGGSTRTLASAVGRHDGHADGHLNCIALRHGWSRTFSISPQELAILDYETLETILEVHTLKLRPMGVRIFVENPVDSGNWSKIRPWKHDGSLQSVLVQQFFEQRREGGVITRVDVRDGTDRQDGDALSLRAVGSRILNRRGDTTDDVRSTASGRTWFGLSRNTSTRSRNARVQGTGTDVEEEDHARIEDRPPPLPAKPSFFSLLRPHPKIPNQTPQRRSIFDFFRAKLLQSTSSKKPTNSRDQQRAEATSSPEEQQLMEVEVLRKRGWIPPGLARRQRSLKERLRSEGLAADGTGAPRNPFFGSSKSFLSRAERKKKAAAAAAATDNTDTDAMVGEDPFADDTEARDPNVHGPDEITEQDVDDFFEIERPTSMMEMEDHPGKDKSWTKFKPSKDRKNKNKARAAANVAPLKGTLGGGAAVVQKPKDAFPDSPHHRGETREETTSVD